MCTTITCDCCITTGRYVGTIRVTVVKDSPFLRSCCALFWFESVDELRKNIGEQCFLWKELVEIARMVWMDHDDCQTCSELSELSRLTQTLLGSLQKVTESIEASRCDCDREEPLFAQVSYTDFVRDATAVNEHGPGVAESLSQNSLHHLGAKRCTLQHPSNARQLLPSLGSDEKTQEYSIALSSPRCGIPGGTHPSRSGHCACAQVLQDMSLRLSRADKFAVLCAMRADKAEHQIQMANSRAKLAEIACAAERLETAFRAREREAVVTRLQRERDCARLALARAEEALARHGEFPKYLAELQRSHDELQQERLFLSVRPSQVALHTRRIANTFHRHRGGSFDVTFESLLQPDFVNAAQDLLVTSKSMTQVTEFDWSPGQPKFLEGSLCCQSHACFSSFNSGGLRVQCKSEVLFSSARKRPHRLPPKKFASLSRDLVDAFDTRLFEGVENYAAG